MAEYKRSRGLKVKRFRFWLQATRERFAEMLGVTPRLIKNVETGRQACSRVFITRLRDLARQAKAANAKASEERA